MGWFPPPPNCLPAKLSSVWAAGLTHWHWPPGGEAERCDVPNDCLMFHDNSIGLVPELSIRISFTFSSRSFGDTLFLVFGSATAASGCGTRHFQPIAPPPAAALPAQLIWWTAALLPAALLPSQFHAPSVVCCLMLLCVSVRSGTGPSARQSPPANPEPIRIQPHSFIPWAVFWEPERALSQFPTGPSCLIRFRNIIAATIPPDPPLQPQHTSLLSHSQTRRRHGRYECRLAQF